MAKQYLVIDAWIREAQEAAKLVEEIETRVKNKKLKQQKQQQQEQQRLGDDIAGSKLSEVGVKLDRLESLLHNPPSKPILTNEDLESRWKMLWDIKLRTKTLAVSLYAIPSATSNRLGNLPAGATKEISRKANSYGHDDQIKVSSAKDEPELLNPLLCDDATQNHMQIKHRNSFISTSLLQKVCWIICTILGVAAFVFILVILSAFI